MQGFFQNFYDLLRIFAKMYSDHHQKVNFGIPRPVVCGNLQSFLAGKPPERLANHIFWQIQNRARHVLEPPLQRLFHNAPKHNLQYTMELLRY